jgi:hypothetical protein
MGVFGAFFKAEFELKIANIKLELLVVDPR